MNNYLVVLVGPTAIGKTKLSIKLARHLNAEIFSADSRQFYSEMSIGTAVPEPEELKAVKHHFIQHISVRDEYSVGDFEKDAITALNSYFKTHSIGVLVGGSGLYIQAVTEGLDEFPDIDPEIREELNRRFRETGLKPLQQQLQKLDPRIYKNIDIENRHRLIRALEVCLGTGLPYSSFLKGKKSKRDFETIFIGIKAEREIVYDRINKRVEQMLQKGLVDEVMGLREYRELNALNTVGYKEIFNYLDGHTSLEEAIAEIKKNTRRFAKRQLTWFRKNKSIRWFEKDTEVIDILNYLDQRIKKPS